MCSTPSEFITQGSFKAPYSYWKLKDYKQLRTNGCGSQDITALLVPDKLFGTSIYEACAIHDHMYSIGETKGDRKIADKIFLENMMEAIDKDKSHSLLKLLKKVKAYVYYLGVRILGGSSHPSNKNKFKSK